MLVVLIVAGWLLLLQLFAGDTQVNGVDILTSGLAEFCEWLLCDDIDCVGESPAEPIVDGEHSMEPAESDCGGYW